MGDRVPAWRAARTLKAVTPAELYARRSQSPALGTVLFIAFVVYTLPYLVASVLGVGVAVSVLTGDAVSLEAAALGLLGITLVYTATGGMRATMWTNVFQGTVFVGFVLVAFVGVAQDLGGFEAITARVQAEAPELLVRGVFMVAVVALTAVLVIGRPASTSRSRRCRSPGT